MPTSAQVLGKYAAELAFVDYPPALVERAKDCIIDIVGVSTFQSQFPCGRMVADYVRRGGPCSLVPAQGERLND